MSVLLMALIGPCIAIATAPMVKMKVGNSKLTVDAGSIIAGESLTPTLTLQPSILWAIPSFSSRMGVHYIQEFGGAFGLTPISGIGLSGYYYLSGISTSYTNSEDGTVISKSKPGVFLYAGLTPVNFNLNKSATNFFFSSFLYEISAGIGYDYPVTQNLVISAEYLLRNGISNGSSSDKVSYSGSTIFISFGSSYF